MQVFPVLPEVQDRVSHQLPGAVKGHIAAAFDLEHSDAAALQLRRRKRETRDSSASSEGDHRLVLYQEQDILGDLAIHAAATETALELQHLGISPLTEILHHQSAAHA